MNADGADNILKPVGLLDLHADLKETLGAARSTIEAMIYNVMGVEGSGKTTVAKMLAQRLGWVYLEADQFHSEGNKDKMRRGIPLTDDDRLPWLEAIHTELERQETAGENVIAACSVLKEKYREVLSAGLPVRYVYLKGSYELIRSRLRARHGHFAGEAILANQFEVLEEPKDAIVVDVAQTPEEIVAEILVKIRQEMGKAEAPGDVRNFVAEDSMETAAISFTAVRRGVSGSNQRGFCRAANERAVGIQRHNIRVGGEHFLCGIFFVSGAEQFDAEARRGEALDWDADGSVGNYILRNAVHRIGADVLFVEILAGCGGGGIFPRGYFLFAELVSTLVASRRDGFVHDRRADFRVDWRTDFGVFTGLESQGVACGMAMDVLDGRIAGDCFGNWGVFSIE